VKVISNQQCKRPDWYGRDFFEQSMVCAGYAEGRKDSCTGDSGGPLVCLTSSHRWTLFGVVSWGDDCAKPRKPGVYARTAPVLDWIKSHVPGTCIFARDSIML